MKKRALLVSLVLVAVLLTAAIGLAAAQPPDNPGAAHAPDQILVKFLAGTPERDKDDAHQKHGGRVVDVIPGIDVQVVKIAVNKVEEKVRGYRGEARVEFAEPDFIATAVLEPNDPDFGKQWGMTKIQAPQAWDITQGSASIKIAILDTGIDQDHQDLAGKIVDNKNFTTSATVDDKYGHGTHVAGIAAAATNNGIGVAGVGFNSTLMNGKVLGDDGSGYYSWVANGIVWAADSGTKVINMSLGGKAGSKTLQSAVDYAWKNKGVVLAAAAGNQGSAAAFYPAYYTNCMAVAATDKNDVKASFSNFGKWVDIAAPGVDIYSTLPNHSNRFGTLNYGSLSGTSMATPHVAGVAALVFAAKSGWTNAQVRDRIQTSGDPTTGFNTAIKRVNAFKAVQ